MEGQIWSLEKYQMKNSYDKKIFQSYEKNKKNVILWIK